MIAKVKTIKRINYYLTAKEVERINIELKRMNLPATKYAEKQGVSKSNFTRILNGASPMTANMYNKAFKYFDCLADSPIFYEIND